MTNARFPAATLIVPLLRQNDAWLSLCIESALHQTAPCEVIVVTDSRTPRSNLEVLNRLDPGGDRLRVCQRPAGLRFAGALNYGIAQASCERVGFLLTDDWLEPEAVAACLAHDADIVATQAWVYGADGRRKIERLARVRTESDYAGCPDAESRARYLGHFMLFSRAAVTRAGGVDETVGDSPGVDDYHLLWTMLDEGASVRIVERALYNHRDHDGERLTNHKPLRMWHTMFRILTRHGMRGEAREERLLWHTRWFGGSIERGTDPAIQRMRWAFSGSQAADGAREVAPLVLRCARQAVSSATLEVHARRISRDDGLPVSAALAALKEAASEGLLEPARRTSTPLRSHDRDAVPTTLGIMACEQPQLVERALEEFVTHIGDMGHPCRVMIVDDSRTERARRAIAELTATVTTGGGCVEYVGRERKASFRSELRATLADSDIDLELALGDPLDSGYTLGANLNALLLETLGEAVLSVDEDVRPITYASPAHEGPISFRPDPPAVWRWYVDDEEARRWLHPVDILAVHGRWLGQRGIARSTGTHVVATCMGVCGYTGFSKTTAPILASADTALRRDRARLEAVLARPRALRCADGVSFNQGTGFTSNAVGIDNRVLVPPFFPIGRGIDLLWGTVAGICRPGAVVAHVPFALAHDRPTAPEPSTFEVPLWAVIADHVRRIGGELRCRPPVERMRAVGLGLVRVGESEPRELAEQARRLRTLSLERERARWQQLLAEDPRACPLWHSEIHRLLARIDEVPSRVSVPSDVRRIADSEGEGWRIVGHLIRSYGNLLRAWPEIVAAAQAWRACA